MTNYSVVQSHLQWVMVLDITSPSRWATLSMHWRDRHADRYIMLSTRRGQRKNGKVSVIESRNKYVRLRGRPYIHTCPPSSTCRAILHDRRICSVTFAVGVCIVNFTSRWLAEWSDVGLLGEQSSPKWEIFCPRRRWTAVRNLTPLALSSSEKSITVQTRFLFSVLPFMENKDECIKNKH